MDRDVSADVELLKMNAKIAPQKVAFDLTRLADLVACMTHDELVIWKEFVAAEIMAHATDYANENVRSKEFNGLSLPEAILTVATNIVFNMSTSFTDKIHGEKKNEVK